MGGCVSPTLAEIFLSFHERNWIDQCPTEFKPVFYRRYVDDTFILFKSIDNAPLFLDYLNRQHPSIKFTAELEKENTISFLDVKVRKTEQSFDTGVFRKSTFTGLGMKFDSAVSNRYKFNLVSCLIDRAYKICSSYPKFCIELDQIRKFFYGNSYPCLYIDKCIRIKLDSIFSPPKPKLTANKKPFFVSIPFLDHASNFALKKQLSNIVSKFYPQLELKIVFINRLSVGSFFKHKDQVPSSLLSNIVYKYKCGQCDSTYIGESIRHFATRIAQHKGVSVRTGFRLSTPGESRIRDHCSQTQHSFCNKNFSVLKVSNEFDIKICESIYIHQLNPDLNSMNSSTPLNVLC